MFSRAVLITLWAILAAWGSPSLIITQSSKDVLQNEPVVIIFKHLNSGQQITNCRFRYSHKPAGNVVEGHDKGIYRYLDRADNNLAFIPGHKTPDSIPQVDYGIIYYIITCPDTTDSLAFYSAEFPLRVEVGEKPNLLSPGYSTTSSMPNISWTPVGGVPAYHVMISDQPIAFEKDTYLVTGISAIWQAITPNTSILYGTPDPSGSISQITPPPLIPGKNYTLVLLNNYDGLSPLATSTRAKEFRVFKVAAQDSAFSSAPVNVHPQPADTIRDEAFIQFKWSHSVPRANTYKIYLLQEESPPGFDAGILVPIWETETTDTAVSLNANETLSNSRYYFKVYATSSTGVSIVSDTTSFNYTTDVRTVVFNTYDYINYENGPDTSRLPDVNIKVNSLDGNIDILPLLTSYNGEAIREFPLGIYEFTFSKIGYISHTLSHSILVAGQGEDDSLNIILTPYTSFINGSVLDDNQQPVALAQITATDDFNGQFKTTANGQGEFKLGLSPGIYRLKAFHKDFSPGKDTIITIGSNSNFNLGPFYLQRPAGKITGFISEPGGIPLSFVNVQARSLETGTLWSTITNNDGEFFFALIPGRYQITASRTGFGNVSQAVDLVGTQRLSFIMLPGSSIISGRISALIYPGQNEILSSPVKDVYISVYKPAGGDTLITRSSVSGDYSLSVADTGTFTVEAYYTGRVDPASAVIVISTLSSTITQNLQVKMYAKIKGTVILNPDTTPEPGSLVIHLANNINDNIVKSIFHENTGSGKTFTFDGVPDGDYRILTGLPGYGLYPEPVIMVRNYIWKTGINLNLIASNKTVRFNLTSSNSALTGTVKLLTPYSTDFTSTTPLTNAAFGTYTMNVTPLASTLIPIYRCQFILDSAGANDTTIHLGFPFSHIPPASLSFQNNLITISAAQTSGAPAIDSIILAYGYNEITTRLKTSNSQLAFSFNPGKQGGQLLYYFSIYTNSHTYSNMSPSRYFSTWVAPSNELEYVNINVKDSILIMPGIPITILANAFTASGLNLDSSLDTSGSIQWQAAGSQLKILEGKNTRSVIIMSESLMDSYTTVNMTAVLSGVTVNKTIHVKAANASINRLIMTTSEGGNVDVLSPGNIEFYIKGLDTSFTPPLVLHPNAKFTLVPPSAGIFIGNKLVIHPDFIGPVRILASHSNPDYIISTELDLGLDSLQRGLNVGQFISVSDTNRLLYNDSLVKIHITDSSITSTDKKLLRMYKRFISPSFTSTKDQELYSSLYEITGLSKNIFIRSPMIILGIPKEVLHRDNTIGIFSDSSISWVHSPGVIIRDSLFASGQRNLLMPMPYLNGYYYGLLNKSLPLNTSKFEIIPNPFSPLVMAVNDGNTQYGARIRFQPQSNKSDRVIATLKIYNMRGELVRTIEALKSLPKIEVDYYWDGKTDTGLWARNGRYLAVLILKEISENKIKKFIKSIVLFK